MSKRLEEIAEEVLDGVFGKVPHSPQYKTLVMLGYEQAEKDLGWVSLLERLPEPGEWVLACIDDCGGPQCLSLAAYNERMGIWINDRDELVHLDYWMPIPGFRKEEQ